MSSVFQRILKRPKDAILYLDGMEKGSVNFDSSVIAEAIDSGIPPVVFKAVKILLLKGEKAFLKKLISKKLNIKEEDIEVENFVLFKFPGVNSQESHIINGVAIPLKSGTYCIDANKPNFGPIENLVGKGFVVVFDHEFYGDSFQASLSYGLLFGKLPDQFLLSGSIDYAGNIHSDKLDEKESLAKREGKLLISKGNIFKIKELLAKESLEIPFVIFNGSFPFHKFCKDADIDIESLVWVYSVSESDFTVELPPVLERRLWTDYVEVFVQKLNGLKNVFKEAVFHVGIKVPAAYALGCGAAVGTGKLPVVLYHFENGNYCKVIDLSRNSRKIKKRVEEFKLVKVKEFSKGLRECVVAIQLASHETFRKAKELAEKLKADYFYICISDVKGAIPLDFDWCEIVSEVYSALNHLYDLGYESMHIVMSVPVSIGFAVGMAVGNYWDVKVYNYFKNEQEYSPVLNLKDIPSI